MKRSMLAVALVISCASPVRRAPEVRASAPQAPAPPPIASAPVPAGPELEAPPADPPRLVAFAGDGTLLVEGSRSLLAWTSQGGSREVPLPEGQRTLVTSSAHAGVVLVLPERVALLTTPDLAVAHDGPGTALTDVPAITLERERVLLVQAGSKLARLDTRSAPPGASVETVTPLLGGMRFSVTFVETAPDGSARQSALLYDPERQLVLGPGLPFQQYPIAPPRAGVSGKIGFSIENRQVLRWDLEKGTVERRAVVRCTGDRELGNPTPSPNGDLLVVTCGDDLVVLDGVTLKSRRRVTRVVPGCDQGPILNGTVLPDGKTLLLEGCGGIAKLDLGRGKYTCGDSAGVMGAPYLDAPPAPGAAVGVPAGRASVPACTQNAEAQPVPLGRTGRSRIVYGERMRIVQDSTELELEADSQVPVLSPDEVWLAYARTDHVVVRGLPDGKVRTLLRLGAR
ncbi:MAG: hypothetical protein HS104_32415 [Polyangiaceae bacterium]|nr:hypothetical protein [Polyangiaceae bacterium]MCL4749190.1 hypothetical protein [Myxococcales bacterium]